MVLHHPKIKESKDLAEAICEWLVGQGLSAWMGLTWDEQAVRPRIPGTDLIITLGGDGSMLRSARMAAGHTSLILGVNMGRVGFLSEMSPANWQERLPEVFKRRFWVENRMMLQTETWRNGTLLGTHIALNDVVLSRGSLARVVQLKTEIDGEPITTYVADGLIISTPTGSTAYALAVGGPIMPPELRNILVIPIAPHLTLDRAIVLAKGSHITIHVRTDHQAILTVDGQFEFEIQDGDRVEVQASEHFSHFIRLDGPTYFYKTLVKRLT
jgi:NAD+ kinase